VGTLNSGGSGLALVVDALATYRLTRLLIEDEIAAPVRDWVWDRHDPADSKIGYLFTCPWCVSIWAGAAVVVARRVSPTTWEPVARMLTASAVTGMISTRL
jgi:hypothetical protein